ncbi:MAG: radical SAM protein, partial [Candidatus Aenigmarchaeota archaeon]|nr:radical SAM protein [Candidatus Aenigmarchaeota archaeon]
MIIKTSIIMGYECNNNCRFCYCGDKRDKYKSMTTNEIKSELKNGRKRGSTFVDFLGGEPTIRKDLSELISYAKDIGYKTISVTTNGRLFSYKDFCENMIDAGLNSAVFSIHGHIPELHDYLTRSPGSFRQAIQGIKNIKKIKPDFYICTNTTIVKQNYRFLPQIAENNIKTGVDALEFIFVHPRGNALKNFDQIVPTLTEVEPFIPKTLKIGKKYNIKHFVFRYFPLCYMKGYEKNLSELTAKEIIQEQHIGPEFEDLNVEENRAKWGRIKGPQCKKCKFYNRCEGIFKEYAERRGFDELKPILSDGFNPMSIVKLKKDEILKTVSRGSKYFIKTKYVTKDAYTGGYHKYFKNLSLGRYKKNVFDNYEGWGGPRTWKFIFKHMAIAEKILSSERPVKVLDIGCSSGFMRKILESNTFKKENIYYYGIDAREKKLLSAISNVDDIESAASGNNITSVYINHDVRHGLPFKDKTFDFVISFEMTKYLKKNNVKNLFGEISRVLKPHGKFIYSTAGICDNKKMMNLVLKFKDKMKSFWYLDELKKTLAKHKLNVMKVYGSESNYDTIRKLLTDEDKKTFIKMDSFYPKEIVESIFGPLYPESTATKLFFITKGKVNLRTEIRKIFPNNNVKQLKHNGNSEIFTVDDKIVKYLSKHLLEKYIKIYKMLKEQTNIQIPRIFGIKESQMSENYIIIMEHIEGEPLILAWNRLSNNEKKDIITKIVNILKQIHLIRMNPCNLPVYMRIFHNVHHWKDELEIFLKNELNNNLTNKKINNALYNYFNS